MLTIGRLAERVGLQAKTLRYYDRVGLLPPATRTAAGYRRSAGCPAHARPPPPPARRPPAGSRLYVDGAARRLRFIRRPTALGIPLPENGEPRSCSVVVKP